MAIQADNYMTIYGWMRTDLGLKGNELLIYALIYGFSLSGQWYSGSRDYLSEWIGCSVKSVQRSLDKLTKDGLLIKQKSNRNGKSVCAYSVSCMDKMSTHEWTNCPSMKDKMSLNNNIYNNNNKYIYNKRSKTPIPEHETTYNDQNINPDELEELLFEERVN